MTKLNSWHWASLGGISPQLSSHLNSHWLSALLI